MGRVVVEVRIEAPPARVWAALTEPDQVTAWDGVVPLAVPPGYPAPGHHARWRTHLGPVPLTLHDRVQAVEPGRRLASAIAVGVVRVAEEYRLVADGSGTLLVSDNDVRATVPGLGRVAGGVVRRNIEGSMARLRRLCEG